MLSASALQGGETLTDGASSDQADLRNLGQANEQLQKDLQLLDPQHISAYLANNGNLVRPCRCGMWCVIHVSVQAAEVTPQKSCRRLMVSSFRAQESLKAVIQQGFPPDTPSQRSLEGLYVHRSMGPRRDSAGSEGMTAGMSPRISPHASPKVRPAARSPGVDRL